MRDANLQLDADFTQESYHRVEPVPLADALPVTTTTFGTTLVSSSTDATSARAALGLGTLAVQNAGAVGITGGSITGITDLAVADGGTGASTAANARTNLGLGTMATQNAGGVSITGGAISGIAALAVADGGTGASTATNARTSLGIDPVAALKSNLNASAAPTVNDDSGDGYGVGSLWVDTTADDAYMALDVTVGAAVWKKVTP